MDICVYIILNSFKFHCLSSQMCHLCLTIVRHCRWFPRTSRPCFTCQSSWFPLCPWSPSLLYPVRPGVLSHPINMHHFALRPFWMSVSWQSCAVCSEDLQGSFNITFTWISMNMLTFLIRIGQLIPSRFLTFSRDNFPYVVLFCI